eukprot:TRINITY_DN61384_c0_g1_i1.p1 TRINITY_DN61384_c0_g1~~TRINITY_DN61384_c0_g1_i1.p1  ORF type:complete len:268 (+),score=113.25 TRINITY_DN61384_c0_g1_i1:110-805(+)
MASADSWSRVVVFFAAFLIAYGAALCAVLHYTRDPDSTRELHALACLLLGAGIGGAAAGMLKNRFLVFVQVTSLLLLAGFVFHLFRNKLEHDVALCVERATERSLTQKLMVVEVMPGSGIFLGVGSEAELTEVVDTSLLAACRVRVSHQWIASCAVLLAVLLSCLTCSWRFAVSLAAEQQELREVAIHEDDDEDEVLAPEVKPQPELLVQPVTFPDAEAEKPPPPLPVVFL